MTKPEIKYTYDTEKSKFKTTLYICIWKYPPSYVGYINSTVKFKSIKSMNTLMVRYNLAVLFVVSVHFELGWFFCTTVV